MMDLSLADRTRRCGDYLQALEEERRKILVFQRELPLCLQLVTQTIESLRQQMESMVSEETVSDGPVLEEFIPLRPSFSNSSEEESNHEVKKPVSLDRSETKPDWLQSVQLWNNQDPDQSPPPPMERLCKPIPVNARKTGGAFQPFEKEKHAPPPPPPLPASSAGAASSSAGGCGGSAGDRSEKKEKEKEKEKEEHSQNHRKARRCWSPELHRRFLHALQQLGGSHVATPKQIRELMKVDGLTNDEVKSHLQKYRLHTNTRRPGSAVVQSNGNGNSNTPGPQFVVVGGIWVPPADYAAVAVAQPAADVAPSGHRTTGIYVPVASVPSSDKQQIKRLNNNNDDDDDVNNGKKKKKSASSTSSSSQTTTASPPF